MTIFGNHNASDNSTSCCNIEGHDATKLDEIMNMVLGAVLLVAALISVMGNLSVFMYYCKSQTAPFSEFLARCRQHIIVARAVADLVYNARTIYVVYVLLKEEQEPLCTCICSSIQKTVHIINIVMYGLFMASLILTFVISVLNYANVLGYTINRMVYGPNIRSRAKVIFFIVAILLFAMVFVIDIISSTGLDFDRDEYFWLSPIQLGFRTMDYDVEKWILFGSKFLLLVLHVFFAVVGWVNIVRLHILRPYNLKRLCVSMCLLILGNCLCLILSLVKDIVTNFLDFAPPTSTQPYNFVYLLFVADVLMQSLLAAYNPVIFIVNSKSVQRTVLQTLTETVVFTKVSVSRHFQTIQQEAGIVDDVEQARPSPAKVVQPPGARSANHPTSIVFNRTISITVFTSVDIAEPVTGEDIRLPLNHIPSQPTISIPIRHLLNPMSLAHIGNGFFGNVYRYTDHLIGCSVALKHIQIITQGRARSTVDDVKKEIDINSTLQSHINIVQYVGCVSVEQSNWYIIQEYMVEGSLKTKLITKAQHLAETNQLDTRPVLTDSLILKFTMEMTSGLEYLHQQKIVHRDLRSPNVLISATGTAKLADFGLSKRLEAVVRIAGDYTPDVGNAYWRAPEVMNTEECGFPVDVWSLGITILEMIYNEPPFMKDEPFKYMWTLAIRKRIPEIPQFVCVGIQDMLKKCLTYDPSQRPSAKKLLEHISEIVI
ncbi:hypothetical protein ACHWQZ_G007576 [Mnemiopsis leidyi]